MARKRRSPSDPKAKLEKQIAASRSQLDELAAKFDELSEEEKQEHERLAAEVAEMEDRLGKMN